MNKIKEVESKSTKIRAQVKKSMSPWERLYLVEIFKGFLNVLKHLFFRKSVTYQYPETRRPFAQRFRGEHYLTKDENGWTKCTACMCCGTACPVNCIFIVGEEAPKEWTGRDKHPKIFEIDMLRCIYCGMCIEACPCDAIRMTTRMPIVYADRQSYIYDKNKLLNNNTGEE